MRGLAGGVTGAGLKWGPWTEGVADTHRIQVATTLLGCVKMLIFERLQEGQGVQQVLSLGQ